MGRNEHYRNVCRDLETRLVKESEKFDEAVARKAALQDEINIQGLVLVLSCRLPRRR